VAERLGFRYVDDEVIEQAGEWADLAPGYVGDVERRRPLFDRMLGRVVSPTAAPVVPTEREGRILPGDAELRALIKQALASIAGQGSVVIASHAASFALSGPDVLRVLVTASEATRVRRLAAEREIEGREAERLVKQEDAGRAEYLKQFYGIDRELPSHFDLVVNTDVLTPEKAAEVVAAAAS
jgi:Cytidylate kinase-like family